MNEEGHVTSEPRLIIRLQNLSHARTSKHTGTLVLWQRSPEYVERREDGYQEPERVFIVATAHVSAQSALDVEQVIQVSVIAHVLYVMVWLLCREQVSIVATAHVSALSALDVEQVIQVRSDEMMKCSNRLYDGSALLLCLFWSLSQQSLANTQQRWLSLNLCTAETAGGASRKCCSGIVSQQNSSHGEHTTARADRGTDADTATNTVADTKNTKNAKFTVADTRLITTAASAVFREHQCAGPKR